MEAQLLRELLAPFEGEEPLRRAEENPLSKVDFYEDGLTGHEGSAEKRDALAKSLGLPTGMTPNALLAALKILVSYEEYCRMVGRV